MAPPQTKGTVTPLGSLFSEEEARKAASFVEERIREKREEMNRLQQFVDENDNLISLVKKLPDQLHHNIMVPFGKKAFFPGRLIHTNECLVFLGENYYTDRTSKQTVDVLRRRDKTLQSQIHSLKAEIDDFQTEASFFAKTASEVSEGLLEIREEYEDDEEEEDSSATVLTPGVKKEESSGHTGGEAGEGEDKDDEFARIMAKLNELEMEEEQEEGEGEDEDDGSKEHDVEESEQDIVKGLGDDNRIGSVLDKVSGHSSSIGPKPQYLQKEDQPRGGIPQQNAETWRDFQATASAVSRAKASSSTVVPQKIESPIQKPEPKFDTNKAFTGSIVEHFHNLETNTHGKMQPSGSQPSKPVSRFKAQRR
ncbi:uncharacterized protein LOC130510435 isoform X1 [Raphanus sativus]|uniref:Uncharacterized protein LOC130510435 isoform X1 n=1 Tax=Raphanus sativus TaxID=3726 RepID=A0A9W3DGH2_RAPSA|nr:uncharacterized protein LOC130510435 isoform X1 [Raphanus sativus]